MSRNVSIPTDYARTLDEIKKRVRAAQYDALKAVYREQIALYWDIGGIIVARQEHTRWGRSVVERLAADLQREFPGVSGFSASNLWRMRSFYMSYSKDEKLAPMVREIGWSQNIISAELKGKLPEPAQIQRLLEAVELPKTDRHSSRGEGK